MWITYVTLFYWNFLKTQTIISLFKTLLGFPLLLGKSKLLSSLCWIGSLLPFQALLGPSLSVLQPDWLSFGFTLGFTTCCALFLSRACSSLSLSPTFPPIVTSSGKPSWTLPLAHIPTQCSQGPIPFITLITAVGLHLRVQLLRYFFFVSP